MRLLVLSCLALVLLTFTLGACKSSSSGSATFCDTACLKDSIKFVKEEHPYKPYVYISASKCDADTLTWSYIDMGVNRKIEIPDLVGAPVKISKDKVSCFIKDTAYAWLAFNNCSTGRGYLLKIPYSKKGGLGVMASALNKFDPKFSVAEGLIAFSDRGNIFVEDMATGKKDMMTFGVKLPIDYDKIHETVDSVNVTATHVWANVKVDGNWKTFEKNIELK